MSIDSRKRTAVVTGGSGAIGRAIARRLVAAGHEVILVGRRAAALEDVVAELGSGARAHAADVTDAAWVDGLVALEPEIDVAVHAAAAYAPYGVVESTLDASFERVFAAGPGAAMRLARSVLPGMKARGFGRIVLVGSLAGSLGAHGQGAYATAKAGLVGLARTIALEGGSRGVTANVVEPGLIDTARVRAAVRPDVLAALVRGTAAGRLGTVFDVAAVVSFLVSPDASFVTGAVIPVTGGLGLGLPRP